jgi:hypothetical protein
MFATYLASGKASPDLSIKYACMLAPTPPPATTAEPRITTGTERTWALAPDVTLAGTQVAADWLPTDEFDHSLIDITITRRKTIRA